MFTFLSLSQRRCLKVAVLFAACAGCMPALADNTAPLGASSSAPAAPAADRGAGAVESAQGSEADKLADLQASIPLLRAKAEIAKLNAEIASANAAASRAGISGMPLSGLPPIPSVVSGMAAQAALGQPLAAVKAPAERHAHAEMRTVSISGFDGRYRAVLDLDGRSVSVQPGDSVSGGWTVVSISEYQVHLRRGRENISLGM